MTRRHPQILRPQAMPPIGDCTPPASADAGAALRLLVAGLALATLTLALVGVQPLLRVALPQAHNDALLFPKDQSRVTDANGNPMEARR